MAESILVQRYKKLEKSAEYLAKHEEIIAKVYGYQTYIAIKDEVIIGCNNDRVSLYSDMTKKLGNDFEFSMINLEEALKPKS